MKIKLYFVSLFIMMSGVALPQSQPDSADMILKNAYEQAAREKKNVFVIFHASWCGWCKKLDASINDPACKSFFDKNFLFVHLTVLESKDKKNLENPGATEMLTKYAGERPGIPFFLIFDRKGKLLADSKIRPSGAEPGVPGQNMGCPATTEEIDAFFEVLRKTSNITDKDISAVREVFSRNRN